MKGVVFLGAASYNHLSTQTLSDLLNEPGDFVPFRKESGLFSITNQKTIAHIRFEPQEHSPKRMSLGHS